MNKTYEPTIGIEVHVQLKTKTKMFSGTPAVYGAPPNTQASIIDLGYPGVLPTVNKEAVRMAIKFGCAIQANIACRSEFARKNYFYPDLPKGFQISQHDKPIVENGYLDITLDDGSIKRIRIHRAHLEEDSGKMLHEGQEGLSGLDFNRAGIPLLEIVSSPDMHSPEEASAYLKALHTLVRYLDICDANMQEGSFRADVNISVKQPNDTKLGTRVEIKNLNSFRFVEKAIEYEIARQSSLLEQGQTIRQETRSFDMQKNETRSMRAKESLHDYRYFPEPDLLPLVISDDWINEIAKTIPELPHDRRTRFMRDFEMTAREADLFINQQDLSIYFEELMALKPASNKLAVNWVLGELLAALNESKLSITESPVSASMLAELLARIHDKTISGTIAKEIFQSLWNKEGTVDQIIEAKGLKQVSHTGEIEKWIMDVIEKNPAEVSRYKNGETKLFGFLVGQVMKASKGKANPQQVNSLLEQQLRKR